MTTTMSLSSIVKSIGKYNETCVEAKDKISLSWRREAKGYTLSKKTGVESLAHLGFSCRYNGTDNGLELSVEKFSSFKFNVAPTKDGKNKVSAVVNGKRFGELCDVAKSVNAGQMAKAFEICEDVLINTLHWNERNLEKAVEEYKRHLLTALKKVGVNL